MKNHVKTLSRAAGILMLLVSVTSSCKKDKKTDPTPAATSSITGTIDGKTIKLDAAALTSTYYSTDGDASKALETSATLNASGDKLNFFLNDLKSGLVAITKKAGTSFNPGNYKIKINADTPSPVQSYVSYFSGGNTYFAYSGSIEITITDTSITVKWSINFKDASGREFNSAGSFTFINFLTVTKPKLEVKDPTPVAAKPTIENISPTSGKAGDSVSITGVNYSTVASENEVKFNGVTATVRSASATRLVVTAPQNGTTGTVTLKVKNSDLTTGPNFTYTLPPSFTSLSPTSGKVGDTVIINGTNFSTTIADNVIQFNSPNGPVNGTVTSATATQIKVTVPQTAKTGVLNVIIKNTVNLVTTEFTVTAAPPVNTGTWAEMDFTVGLSEINASASSGTSFMFAGTTGNNYLYYSADGSNYTNVYASLPFTNATINLVKSDGDAYYVTTSLGLAKTINGGRSWTKITPDDNFPNKGYTGLVVKGDQLTLMEGGVVYKSNDGGATFTKSALTNATAGLTYVSSDYNGKYFYAINDGANFLSSTTPKTLFRSTNQGLTWSAATAKTGLYFYGGGEKEFLEIAGSTVYCLFSADSTRASIADQRLYRSNSQGNSWTKVSDTYASLVKSFGDYIIYSDGGSITVSADAGNTFKNYPAPTGYIVGGVTRAGGYIYIFSYNTQSGPYKFRIFRRQI
jgi:hypothetical protein